MGTEKENKVLAKNFNKDEDGEMNAAKVLCLESTITRKGFSK
jgi:hypothetical protein